MARTFKEVKDSLLLENTPLIQAVIAPTILPKEPVMTNDILKHILIRDAKGVASFLGNAVVFHLDDDFSHAKEILNNHGFMEHETNHFFNEKVGIHVFCKRQPDNVTTEMYISTDGINPYKFSNMLNTLQYGWLGVEKPIPVDQPEIKEVSSVVAMQPTVAGDAYDMEMSESTKCMCAKCKGTCGDDCDCENCTTLTEEEKGELAEIEKEEAEEAKAPETADDPKPYDDKYLSPEECWWTYFEEVTEQDGTVMNESELPKGGVEVIHETVTREYVYRNGKLTLKFRTNKPGYKIVRDGNTVRELPMSQEEQRKRKLAALKSRYKRRSKKTSLFRKRRASIKKHKAYMGYKPYKKRK